MAKIIQTSDLRFAAGDNRYGFAVLDMVIAQAVVRKADLLLVAGGLFASLKDLEALHKEVFRRFLPCAEAGCEVIFAPGAPDIAGLDGLLPELELGPVKLAYGRPFTLMETKGVQLLCLPPAADYDDYRGWSVPHRAEGLPRLLAAHALSAELYSPDAPAHGPALGVIPEDLLRRFGVDFAALGGLPGWLAGEIGPAQACYPGCPAVHGPGPAGPRFAALLDTEAGFTPLPLELPEAGQYRSFTLPITPAATLHKHDADHLLLACGPMDFVEVTLCGAVESADNARIEAEQLKGRLLSKCRAAEVSTEIVTAPALAANASVKAFLAEIDLVKPPVDAPEFAGWALARQYGLKALVARTGGAV